MSIENGERLDEKLLSIAEGEGMIRRQDSEFIHVKSSRDLDPSQLMRAEDDGMMLKKVK